MDQILREGNLLPRGPWQQLKIFLCFVNVTIHTMLNKCSTTVLQPQPPRWLAHSAAQQALNLWSFCLRFWPAKLQACAIRPASFDSSHLSSNSPFALQAPLCSSSMSGLHDPRPCAYRPLQNTFLQYFTWLAHRQLLVFQMRSHATSLERSSPTLPKSHHVLSPSLMARFITESIPF